ncbi:Peptide deformylase 2 [Gammaproteobacteria bacterium]
MPILEIATIGQPVLREASRPVCSREELASSKIQNLIDDLIDTMHNANGIGIAANQVYQAIRICVIHVKENPRYPRMSEIPLTVLVNPRIELMSDQTFISYEGCLSVPNVRGEVPRFEYIRITAWDRNGQDICFEVKGMEANVYQHECDHLNGKLFVDKV